MRQRTLLATTLREAPAEAETASHRLLLRAGYIRQLAAGVYTFLPLGLRALRKVERIVREEMERAGAQEMLMPALQPAELLRASGRYGLYGPDLFRLQDRQEREFALGPTHEEVVTGVVQGEIRSYRKLPAIVFQVQSKFRDERRPRSGLLRTREFVMKDAYSFDADWDGLDRSYQTMYEAYHRIFSRCGLNYRAVEADSGTIGGEGGTHEFMALADIGEDTIVACPHCDYAANMEQAETAAPDAPVSSADGAGVPEPVKFHTPGIRTIDELERQLGIVPRELIKTLLYVADGKPVAVLLRGDHTGNEVKIKRYLGAEQLELADEATVRAATGAPVGYAGPIGLQVPLLVDRAAAVMPEAVVGAGEADHHIRHARPGRDFALAMTGDFRCAAEGDCCPRCKDGVLRLLRGIEVGHVFKLGTRYSGTIGAAFLDREGKERTVIMGCYGIGISRLLAAIAEQHHDEAGLKWPAAVAPFGAHVIPVSAKDGTQLAAAESIYRRLAELGVDALLDDRDERPGVKFKDADLLGIPVRIVVGKHAERGEVEVVDRASGTLRLMSIEAACTRALAYCK
ncbi:proline--tRNA ligase [Paenibacillus cymbidii]|uniref:proline--tRNA ligase n=1 Tax=Paenibacillus cymbidii TaxID=1639034 RepID=UPI001080DEEA|nr:proline--tRNA ligase [Paenibacillus cymbidii]